MTFKEKLVKLRKLKGLTQDEFASAVGVSRQAVYKWESGQSYPEVSKLLEMKILFNISIDDLLDENYEVIVPEKKKRKRIPKEVKAEVESSIVKEETESLAVAQEETKEEPVAVAVAEQSPAEVEVKATAEEAPAKVEEEVSATVKEVEEETAEDDSSKKKVGFFGRLFGRK